MKQKLFTYSSILLLFLGLASCTQDESQMTDGVEGTPMIFTATGLDFADAHSRATVDNDWQGIKYVVVKIGDEVKKYKVDAGTNPKSALLTSDDPFFWTSTALHTVSAWPYTEPENENEAETEAETETLPKDMPIVEVNADQSGAGFAASDFIAAEPQYVSFEQPVLKFTHRTARITVTLTDGGVGSLAGASVKLDSVIMKSGVEKWKVLTLHNSTENVYEALVVPQTIKKNQLFIKVELNDKSFFYPSAETVNFEAGKRYNYTISVDEVNLGLEEASQGEWTDAEEVLR